MSIALFLTFIYINLLIHGACSMRNNNIAFKNIISPNNHNDNVY